MNMNTIKDIIIIIAIIIPPIIVFKWVSSKVYRTIQNKALKIIESKPSISVTLYDVLVLRTRQQKEIRYLPILKDKKQNTFYIQSPYERYHYLQIFLDLKKLYEIPVKIICKNLSNYIVEYDQEGRLYINNMKGTVKIKNNEIDILGETYYYEGKIEVPPVAQVAYSVKNENILNELNNAVIYYGIEDFDKEGVLKDYIKNAKL